MFANFQAGLSTKYANEKQLLANHSKKQWDATLSKVALNQSPLHFPLANFQLIGNSKWAKTSEKQ